MDFDIENIYKIKHIEHFSNVEITKKEIVQQIYQMLKDMDKLFLKHNINYWMSGGTLLGAIRHNGLIPWDDDADFEILDSDVEKFLSIDYEKYGYAISQTYFGYKIYPKNGQKNNKYNWKYPFLDIFLCTIKDGRTNFISRRAQYLYKVCTFEEKKLFPLKRYKFGNIFLNGPNEIGDYFSKCYGNDWYTHYYKSYDHEKEKEIKKIKSKIISYEPILESETLKDILI